MPKKRVGTQMRPRGSAVKDSQEAQSEAVSVENKEIPVSQDEVQQERSNGAVLDGSEVAETGNDLEPVPVQLLESEESAEAAVSVATSEPSDPDAENPSVAVLDPMPQVPEEAFALAKALQESAQRISGAEAIRNEANVSVAREKAPENLLANGDLRVMIDIPEYYAEVCRQFAEADGNKPLKQWCTEFFVQHLEAYCTPNKGR